ncbi:NAD(P)-binding protein [Delitschia confertaspora ATCC 74209]|uniref:NAD(P)-binding protein n=1 Tax=Delitschia confertaspora ATCC 74209 TaxID=1513339 RepID=A0A9P4JS08_9PLEO|nr:NAD(P)-binding protein [Delitschia confertaspora ATCC 74209]
MASFRTTGVALVTGAASGIGLGAANALAEAGALAVVFADIDKAGIRASSEDSKKFATNPDYSPRAYVLDVRNEASVNAVVEKVVEEFGRIDYLINCAGVDVASYVPIPDHDMEDYDKVLAVNTRGLLLCSTAVIKVMEKQEPRTFQTSSGITRDLGRGAIVNVTSALSYAAVPGKVAYIASKHASLGITKATAQDVKGKGIRVNAICPSWVRTPMYEEECKKFPPVEDFIKASVPVGRPAEVEEIGDSIVYLCSPAATYVNGIGLILDSGLTLTVHLGI